MKKTGDIIGLPVIDLSTGKEIGKVWDLIINGEKGIADFFIIDDGMMLLGAKVVAAKDVQGIGEYAVTVGKGDALKEIGKVEQAVELYKRNVRVKGTEVLTHKGRLIGRTGDIYIDENTCAISALEFTFTDKPEKLWLISRDKIVTFGEKLIVVVEKIEEALEELPAPKEEKTEEEPAESKISASENTKVETEMPQEEPSVSPGIIDENKNADLDNGSVEDKESDTEQTVDMQPAVEQKAEPEKDGKQNARKPKREETKAKAGSKQKTPALAEIEESGEINRAGDGSEEIPGNDTFKEGISARTCSYKADAEDNPDDRQGESGKEEDKKQEDDKKKTCRQDEPRTANVFEQKQREFLIGRKVTKVIKDKMGNIILNEGENITGEAVDRAKDAGKLIEIVMNNRP